MMQLTQAGQQPGRQAARLCPAVALLISASWHATFAQPTQASGYLDSLTSTYASGWACLPGADAAANVALYAGPHRIGIYAPTLDRPDARGTCGAAAGTAGFRIDLTPIVAQQFFFQSSLSFVALAPNANPYLLPPLDASLSDPFKLPTGMLTNLAGDGVLSGIVPNLGGGTPLPRIDIYEGGPAHSGGRLIGQASLTAAPPGAASGSFTANLPADALRNLPNGYLPSLYATASYGDLPATQLGSPAMPGAGFANLYANHVQTSAVAGITNTLYTHWLSGGEAFMGLTGSVGFVGNDPSFSEALLTVGFTTDSQLACQQKNATTPSSVPPFSRLAGIILKSNDTLGDSLPVSIALPYGIAMAGQKGSCLLLWISAGYPFSGANAAKYVNTNSRLAAMIAPSQPNAPVAVAEGIGGEFQFPAGATDDQYTVIAMRLKAKAQIDAIAGSVSAGGFIGAPSGSAFLPTPAGNWIATTSFYAVKAPDCAALGLTYGPGIPYFAVGRSVTPASFTIPAAARQLVSVPLHGLAAIVSEQSFFQTFGHGALTDAAPLALQPGDCVIAFHHVSSAAGGLDGVLDFENQSTVYFHLIH